MECSICLGSVGTFCETACRHAFHKECLSEWYNKGTKTCPMCRKSQAGLSDVYALMQKKNANVREVLTSLGTDWNALFSTY